MKSATKLISAELLLGTLLVVGSITVQFIWNVDLGYIKPFFFIGIILMFTSFSLLFSVAWIRTTDKIRLGSITIDLSEAGRAVHDTLWSYPKNTPPAEPYKAAARAVLAEIGKRMR